MNQNVNDDKINNPDEISVGELIIKIKAIANYIKSQWLQILIISLIGGVLGLAYAYIKKPQYTAVSTFVTESGSKAGGLSQYASLASIAGIDITGSSGGGVFQGDNILELYKSRTMIEKALLSSITANGKPQLLIERYIEFNDLLEKWKKKDHINTISFHGDPGMFDRKQDSIITDIADYFNKKVLSVSKIDKKLDIIKVEVTTKDELFSKEFNNALVKTVIDFYTQTKTKKSLHNVMVLQKQADSVRAALNNSFYGYAAAIDAAPNANPSLLTLRVPSQKRQVDVQANTAIYSEMVKNLEVSKMSLREETPLIQIIDQPVLPLIVDRVGKITGTTVGFILGFVLSIIWIIIRKFVKALL